MLNRSMFIAALCGSALLAGCADGNIIGGSALTTQSVAPATPAVDPTCFALSSQIDTLRKDGIADKIEKAAAKKHKMTAAELKKAADLNKANAEFQAKCSTLPKSATQSAAVAPAVPAQPAAAVPAQAAKTVAKADAAIKKQP